MKNVMKYFGLLISLIGVIILIIRQLIKSGSNELLAVSVILAIVGLMLYIILNKTIES